MVPVSSLVYPCLSYVLHGLAVAKMNSKIINLTKFIFLEGVVPVPEKALYRGLNVSNVQVFTKLKKFQKESLVMIYSKHLSIPFRTT
jgi:hypothetical protein